MKDELTHLQHATIMETNGTIPLDISDKPGNNLTP